MLVLSVSSSSASREACASCSRIGGKAGTTREVSRSVTEEDPEALNELLILVGDRLSLGPASAVAESWVDSFKVCAHGLVSVRVLVPLWVIVRGNSWFLAADHWLFRSSLEESGPDCTSVITWTTEESARNSSGAQNSSRFSESWSVSDDRIVDDWDADPEGTTVVLAASSSVVA